MGGMFFSQKQKPWGWAFVPVFRHHAHQVLVRKEMHHLGVFHVDVVRLAFSFRGFGSTK